MGEPRKSMLREFLPGQLREYTGGYRIKNFLGNTQFAKLYCGRITDDADSIHVVTVRIWDDSLCVEADSLDQWSKMMDEVHLLLHLSVNGHQQNFAKPIGYSHNCERPGVVYDLNPRDTLHKEILKGRSAPRPAACPAPGRNPPQPVNHAPPSVPVQTNCGGSLSTIAQGMAFGTGSAVAHRAVDAVMGS
ncbi:hypothetical protein ACH5RR_022368, partial [Cinchona calisaya]